MKTLLLSAFVLLCVSCTSIPSNGLVTHKSPHSAKETAERFVQLLKEKGLTLVSRIDHKKNAKTADLTLRPTEVIIFGNPKVGTPLMQCEQAVAIDLPQKVMIRQDINNNVWLSYNDPSYLQTRHGISGCDSVIKKIHNVLNQLAIETVSQ